MNGELAMARAALHRRRAELLRLSWEYAVGPKPSGDGACDAFDREHDAIELEISEIETQLRAGSR
jgi:hypothetical protein